MPHTIPLTTKQRASLTALSTQKEQLAARENAYVLAILEGALDVPEKWSGITVTDAGLVLGDSVSAPDAAIVGNIPESAP